MTNHHDHRPLNVTIVLGTRPEAIKLAPVALALAADDRFQPSVLHTGQHRELAADVLDAFGIVPTHTLDLLRPGQDLTRLLGRSIAEIGARLVADEPDTVIVQGDTTTAAGAALAAAQLQLPVIHVEAGLRSGDRAAPFPEEDNRRLISVITDLHLTPTPLARRHLLREGVDPDVIVVTGNTGIDALHTIVTNGPRPDDTIAQQVARHPGPVALVTTHRRESWGAGLTAIAAAVRRLVELEPDLLAVVPMHPNPLVRTTLHAELDGLQRVLLTEPLPYATLAAVLAASTLVLTDSGGIQEEAPSLGIPVLVLRDTTERPEGVTAGAACLVGTNPDAIVGSARAVLHDLSVQHTMAKPRAIYGDGRAAARVIAAIAHRYGLTDERPTDFVPDHGTPLVALQSAS